MKLAECLDGYFANLPLITTLVGFVAFLVSYGISRTAESLMRSMSRGATWCALPNGIAFLICAAYPRYVPLIADVSIAFFMGGIALVVVALYDISAPAKPSGAQPQAPH